jgi:hypothetical protein
MKKRYCEWQQIENDEEYYQGPHYTWAKDKEEDIIADYHLKLHPYCSVCGKKIKLIKVEEEE